MFFFKYIHIYIWRLQYFKNKTTIFNLIGFQIFILEVEIDIFVKSKAKKRRSSNNN